MSEQELPENLTREKLRELSSHIDNLFDLGRQQEAFTYLTQALSMSSHDMPYQLYFQAESAWYSEKDRSKQKKLLHQACTLAGDDPFLLMGMGIYFLMNDREWMATKYFNRVLAIKPDDHNAMRCKGLAFTSLGSERKAMEWYRKALTLNPLDSDAMRQIGVSLSKLGREHDAIEWYRKALAINENDYDAMRQMGISLAMLEDYDAALTFLHLALAVNPGDSETKRNLRLVLKKQSGEGETFITRYLSLIGRNIMYFLRRLRNLSITRTH